MFKLIDRILGVGFTLLIWVVILWDIYYIAKDAYQRITTGDPLAYENAMKGLQLLLEFINCIVCAVLLIFSSAICDPQFAWQYGFIQLMWLIPLRLTGYYRKNIQLSLFGTPADINRFLVSRVEVPWCLKRVFIGRLIILFIPVDQLVIAEP